MSWLPGVLAPPGRGQGLRKSCFCISSAHPHTEGNTKTCFGRNSLPFFGESKWQHEPLELSRGISPTPGVWGCEAAGVHPTGSPSPILAWQDPFPS